MKESVLQAKLMARCRKAELVNPDFFWVYSYPAGLTLGYRRDASGRVYSPQAMKAKAMGPIDLDMVRKLHDLALAVDGWWEWTDDGQRFVPLHEWERIYAQHFHKKEEA